MYSNNNDSEEEDRTENLKTKKQKQGVTRKKEEKGKIREKTEKQRKKRKEEKRELVLQACTNRLFPSLPLKILPLPKAKKGVPLGTNHSGSLLSK